MEFRLIYQGPLHSESRADSRTKEKQQIRKYFHKQLSELWKEHPVLKRQREELLFEGASNIVNEGGKRERRILKAPCPAVNAKPWIEFVADEHKLGDYRFVPLIRKQSGFTCALELLFLRRDNPGNLMASGGDIDNRMKVLFDGLRMPANQAELGGFAPEPSEDPFFCLLEDDVLITGLTVTTDRLLIPLEPTGNRQNVHLIIKVTLSDPALLFGDDRLI